MKNAVKNKTGIFSVEILHTKFCNISTQNFPF